MISKKTICVLSRSDTMFFENTFLKQRSTDTCILEAYSSFDDALNALEEEFHSEINELLFKGCESYRYKFDRECDTNKITTASILYTFDGETHSETIFELQFVDLVL